MQLRLAENQDAESVTSVIISAFKKAEAFFIDRDRIDVESVLPLMDKGRFLIPKRGAPSRDVSTWS